MAIGWLLATRIDFKPFRQVAPIAERCGFRLVERSASRGGAGPHCSSGAAAVLSPAFAKAA